MGALSLLWLAIKKRPFFCFGLAIFATLPTEIASDLLGWGSMDPQSYLAEAAWTPIALLCSLALLRQMGRMANPEAGSPALRGKLLASSLGAEILLGMRFCTVILLCAIPALLFLSIFGLEPLWARVAFAALALAAAIPSTTYMLRRLFTPTVVLWQGLQASESLRESARLSQGKLRQVLWPLLLINGFALILEGLSGESLGLAALLLPPSFLLSQGVLAWAYHILTL